METSPLTTGIISAFPSFKGALKPFRGVLKVNNRKRKLRFISHKPLPGNWSNIPVSQSTILTPLPSEMVRVGMGRENAD